MPQRSVNEVIAKSVTFSIDKRPKEFDKESMARLLMTLSNGFISFRVENKEVFVKIGSTIFTTKNDDEKLIDKEKTKIQKSLEMMEIEVKEYEEEKETNYNINTKIGILTGIPEKREFSQIDKIIEVALNFNCVCEFILVFQKTSKHLFEEHYNRTYQHFCSLDYFNSHGVPAYPTEYAQIKDEWERVQKGEKEGWGEYQFFVKCNEHTKSNNYQKLQTSLIQLFSGKDQLQVKDLDYNIRFDHPHIYPEIPKTQINLEELQLLTEIPSIIEVSDTYPVLSLPSRETAYKKGGIVVGTLIHKSSSMWPLMLCEEDFHLLIVSPTRGGKTTWIKNIGSDVMKIPNKRFWVVDPEKSYRDIIMENNGLIFMLRDIRTVFKANLLQPPPGLNKYIWANIWITMLCRAESGGDGAHLMIFNAVRAAYIIGNKHGFDTSLLHVYIILVEFSASIQGSKIGYRLKDYLVTATRMISALLCLTPDGSTDPIFDNPKGFDFKKLLDKNIIVETGNLGGTEKTALLGYLFTMLYHHKRQIEGDDDAEIYLAIDEAHSLFYEAMNGEETEIDSILRQIHKYNVRLILANQGLEKISHNAIINSRTKICFNISDTDERLNKIMGINEIDGLKIDNLKNYHALVKMNQRFTQPVIIETKDRPNKKISDNKVAEYMKPFYEENKEILDSKPDFTIHVHEAVNLMHKDPVIEKYLNYEIDDREVTKEDLIQSMSEDEKKVIKQYESVIKRRFSAKEQRLKKKEEEMEQRANILFDKMVLTQDKILFLKTLIQNPFLPVNDLYEKCGYNKTDGNKIRKELENKDFLISSKTVHPIGAPRVGIILFDIPYKPREERAIKVLEKHGIEYKQNPREGGIVHRYYVNEVIRVSKEAPNIISRKEHALDIPGENKWVDVVNEKVDDSGNVLERTAIEIETCADGYDNTVKNIEKSVRAGVFDHIWILAINKEDVLPIVAFLKEKNILPDPDNKIRVMYIQRLFEKRRSPNP